MVRAHRYRWYASGWLWFHGFTVFHVLQLQVMPYEDFFHRSSNLPVFFRSFSSSVSKAPCPLIPISAFPCFEASHSPFRSTNAFVSKLRVLCFEASPYVFQFFFITTDSNFQAQLFRSFISTVSELHILYFRPKVFTSAKNPAIRT